MFVPWRMFAAARRTAQPPGHESGLMIFMNRHAAAPADTIAA
jgi:hypothetical protein